MYFDTRRVIHSKTNVVTPAAAGGKVADIKIYYLGEDRDHVDDTRQVSDLGI
ncbi:hypothetical protein AGABI1DRAFT_84049 [Agaricus bisporus var. burnettii JB137-S8]|uniref:Uncharacterized protein n=1 Tax=Agaricus bisporus var. burnettii (strain JB137-S8 / ATCC MYA-4627 / FGSC 10392) TaxID=597362 RepID=K5W2W9_AGABU|nr:uncharacterized protein AGABI1DRAFT_84049 [Agaricus bisporus var. burnettii JB137-S8]EKM81114.1 hypothetical protein AGABI1DRAFT_84049 [Agaricus bisporus var. burnettii JB137-S8]